MKTKAIQYAYPTSLTASAIGQPAGGWFITTGERPLDANADIVCGSSTLAEVEAMAEKLEEKFYVFCGETQDGKNLGVRK